MISEQLLLQKINSNDSLASFEELIKKYQNEVFNYINKISNNYHLAQDITQSVFLKLYTKRNSITSNIHGWLFKSAYNTFLDHIKKSNKYIDTDKAEDVSDDMSTSNIANYEISQTQSSLEKIFVDKLTLDERSVIFFNYYDDKSHLEISQIISKPLGTIKTLIASAKQKIKKELKYEH